ncbi:MAG TPA: enoyl-CoA hydratase-related protein [Pseudomonadota bacterium]|nr:enoyl-CoA hydratase/isomerase family protein [Deltaproteobacteria bacterium]HPH25275.1 enoyl-CoA hydratase-related protein [Pseudomonadota bacterium]
MSDSDQSSAAAPATATAAAKPTESTSAKRSGPLYSELQYLVSAGVAHITLNRPERRNPIGPTTVGELLHALQRAKDDPAVRVVVLTGAGKVFSAGGDLSQMSGGGTPLQAAESENRLAGTYVDLNLMLAGRGIGKPTIAKVNGHAMAGGLGLVVACDLAIAADDAQFATPEINVGLWPMMIMSTIFRNVPRKKAMELLLTGDRIDAATAEKLGLITRAVPRERLDAEVQALCDKIVSKSPLVMQMGLDAYHYMQDLDLEPALRHLEGELGRVLGTEDAAEGLMAFLQKRPAQWKGR